MKHLFLKAGILLAVLVLCLAVLISCDQSGTPSDESTENRESVSGDATDQGTENGDVSSDILLPIAENGTSVFRLVASDNATDAEINAVMTIRHAISELTGVDLSMENDWIRPGTEHDPELYEILIGKTNYSETKEVMNNTGYGSYRIAVVGKKIVITAWSEDAITNAANAFLSILETGLKDGNIVLRSEDVQAYAIVDHTSANIPVAPNLALDHIYDANGALEAIFERATTDDFYAYLEKLEKDGCEKYASHERGSVLSAIYTNGTEYTYHVFYEGADRQLCVLAERYNERMLPPKKADYKKVCDTMFVQLGVEYTYSGNSKPQNGMCYIWRLEDGRFIIMDGGFNATLGSKNLMDTLTQIAVDPNNITIASWIITHFHGDHSGTLQNFVKNYLYRVKIESLLFNLPTLEQSQMSEMNWSGWNQIDSALKQSNQNTVYYKAHPGQIYHFANAEVEILYTLEMTAPENLTYYNTCSLITDVRFGDFNMMMLGDCSTVTNANIYKNYGEALEAEVVQVAHHGYDGGSTGLYEKINPKYVFWPAGGTWYATCVNNATENPATDRSAYFFYGGTRVANLYPAEALVTVMYVDKAQGFTSGRIFKTIQDLKDGVSVPAPID